MGPGGASQGRALKEQEVGIRYPIPLIFRGEEGKGRGEDGRGQRHQCLGSSELSNLSVGTGKFTGSASRKGEGFDVVRPFRDYSRGQALPTPVVGSIWGGRQNPDAL